jgi:D-galactarolactone isomerase
VGEGVQGRWDTAAVKGSERHDSDDMNRGYVKGEALSVPWSSGTAPPANAAPVGATDCAHHIYAPGFPTVAGQPSLSSATVEDYKLLKRRLGISRSVVVASSRFGTDNSCLIDALEKLGPEVARGVVLVDPDVSDETLDAFHTRGVRGMRVYLAKNRIPSAEELKMIGRRAADRGWCLQFVGNRHREVLAEAADALCSLPCPVVIDHFGWAPQPAGVNSATAKLLLRVIGEGLGYVKLSGLYLSSAVGFPEYRDLDDLAKRLVAAGPEWLVWGTDWPHPGAGSDIPDGAMLFDRLAEWAPDPTTRNKILVDNPSRLYWT